MRHVVSLPAIGLVAVLTGCGGSSSPSSTSSALTYSIGGSISGLSGTIVLQNNGGDNLTLSANGAFVFSVSLQPDATYDVTVATQPAGQVCSVNNGSGTLSASVANVTVACTGQGVAATEQWSWVAGSDYVDAPGVYGTQGTAAANNIPGARRQPTAWTDATGNFWLFGGYGVDVAGDFGMLNDLWEYSPSVGWVWDGGSDTEGAEAVYGPLGTPADGNNPGAREGAAKWTDAFGNLWLFGGDSLAGQSSEDFNDLWEYAASNSSAPQWTWVGGSDTAGNAGSYGTLGTAASSNLPPARTGAISWVDGGLFWLFGGAQLNSNGSLPGVFNDLWSYDPTKNLWTWVGGSSAPNAEGVYGTQGTAAPGNVPGARMGGSVWVDTNGIVWLFGGLGLDQNGVSEQYNDLWEYNPHSGEWTWAGGSDMPNATGVYGTQRSSAAGNGPGARANAVSWQDGSGNFWLFGGYGYDQTGDVGNLNDLWEYSPGTGVWTWVGGSAYVATSGTYGTQGTPASSNAPGAREQAVGWLDRSGNFWLFGGYGLDAFGEQKELNDLWSFTPSP